MSELKEQIVSAMKEAMRAKDKARLTTIRMILADCKRIEVDERITLDDARVLSILDKMLKQRRDSIQQFNDGGRADLAAIEEAEMAVIQTFMPAQLSEDEVLAAVKKAIADTGAAKMQDMGKVMAQLKPALQGRADMSVVSKLVKQQLA